MATINDDPVTRFTTAQILPTEADIQLGQFFGVPQLTQAQIDEIPVEKLVQGMIVFNTDFDCYMGFVQGSIPNTPGRWCNFNASITYNGLGFEAGSPFALPLGPRSVVESAPNNMDPGVMYVDSETNNQPRIFIPGTGWQDIGISGGSSTFTDLTLTGNLNFTGLSSAINLTNNLTVNGNTAFVGTLVANGPTVITGGNILSVSGAATFQNGITVTNNATAGVLNGLASYKPVVTLGPAAGTGASFSITGSGLSGRFQLTTGSTPIAQAELANFVIPNVTFSAYEYGVCFFPADPSAAGVSASIWGSFYGSGASPNGFKMVVASPALASTTIYAWNYIVIGI